MPSNLVDHVLALAPDDLGPAIVNLAEDQWFDRKSIRVASKDLARTLVAFANAEGGTVIIGVHDGVVEGLRHHTSRVNELRQAAIDHTHPPVHTRFQQVSCRNARGELDTLLVARVEPGDVVHELTNGDCYLRVGDESRKLGFSQQQELHYDRGQPPYDGQPVADCVVSDLHADSLKGFRTAAGASGTFTRLLKARSLLTHRGEVSVAAYLLFAEHPQDRFPHAHVRLLRYREIERGSGSRLNLDDAGDLRIEGRIPQVIENAAAVLDKWVPRRRALGASGIFEGQPIVPRDAWLEGLVNAVVHRSYSAAGDHVRIEVFPDRVEIESPGRFPGLADPRSPLDIARYARNPRIARVCADLRIGQELGEGIRRIFDEMRHRGLTDPAYTQTQGSVRLVLRGSSRVPQDAIERMPKGAVDLLEILRRAERPLGTGQLVDLAGLSRPTVKKQLTALREEGLIKWVGQSGNDPRATWQIV